MQKNLQRMKGIVVNQEVDVANFWVTHPLGVSHPKIMQRQLNK
jgi:hypothetical protein